MNRTLIRKYIIALSMQYIASCFEKNNTGESQKIVIHQNDSTLKIDRNCYMSTNASEYEYLEDYRIDFDGIINMTTVKSLFYIMWENELINE